MLHGDQQQSNAMTNRYWFRPKTYGYGATPMTWEGWALSLAVGAVFAGSIVVMMLLVHQGNAAAWMLWSVAVVGLIAVVRAPVPATDRWRMALALGPARERAVWEIASGFGKS